VDSLWALSAALYVAGVTWGLIVIDARPAARIGLALLWPIGPLAFALTLTVLLAASLIAYPAIGVSVVVAVCVMWWALT